MEAPASGVLLRRGRMMFAAAVGVVVLSMERVLASLTSPYCPGPLPFRFGLFCNVIGPKTISSTSSFVKIIGMRFVAKVIIWILVKKIIWIYIIY
jgi:hypothetical protein